MDDSASPSCHDGVTMTTCPICQAPFSAIGRRKFCSDACRAAAYRRRRDGGRALVVLPKSRPRRPVTVYECADCGERSVGQQYCEPCRTFMRRVGLGGSCPSCGEPVSVTEIVEEEVGP